jgi:hypothetical protein
MVVVTLPPTFHGQVGCIRSGLNKGVGSRSWFLCCSGCDHTPVHWVRRDIWTVPSHVCDMAEPRCSLVCQRSATQGDALPRTWRSEGWSFFSNLAECACARPIRAGVFNGSCHVPGGSWSPWRVPDPKGASTADLRRRYRSGRRATRQ